MIKKKYDLNIKQEQMDKLDEGQKHRKHLGTRHNPCVKLPYQLNFAAKALISSMFVYFLVWRFLIFGFVSPRIQQQKISARN